MSLQKEFVEKFRKDKYKIGSEKDDIELIKQDLQNSISQLANDLYADGIHFVLELIQNADDNTYLSGNSPLLKFVIDEEKILVQNNEKGFTNENVISLCSVGKSKKTKEQGYIGEKGIGFKSVFRISNEPHIFSSGFQFKFKREDKEYGLGYIVPYWIEDVPIFIDKELTNILLPLNSEAKELLYKFNEVEPELLIFLRQLSTVEIQNQVDNTFYKFTKTEENDIVKISGKEREIYFKLVSQELEVPEIIKEEKRNLTKTTLILGFPLNENGTAKTSSEQKVFAFLPTRSYGFKFMIQADFLVPASREAIHNDKKWNEWLIDSISNVFLESVETFKKDENLKINFYNYIPVEAEITDNLFSKVVGQIKNNLLNSDCILTESAKWLKSSQVFRASEEIRSLVSNEDLLEFFGKEFVSTLVQENVESKILNFLEVANFSTNHLIELLKNTEWLGKQSDDWLIKLYEYLKNKLTEDKLSVVKELKIVRLENSSMVSSAQTKTFFPFKENQVYGFESQLPFVKQELLKSKEFLQDLGVFNPQPFEIIENHILEDFENTDENKNWRSRTEAVRIGYIKYIKANLTNYKNAKGNIDRLKDNIWLTLKDNKFWFPKKIYLSKEYGGKYDLEFLLSGIENVHFVHPQYLESDQKEIINTELDETKRIEKLTKVKEDWKNFFVDLGVETIPKIEKTLAERSHWTSGNNHYKRTVEIYSCPVICILIESLNAKKKSDLLTIIDDNWGYYKNFSEWNDCSFYYEWHAQKMNSDWYVKIANAEWLPVKNGGFDKPSKLFLDKPEIRDILGDSVFYLDAEIKNEEFRRALKINAEVKVETVIETLKSLVTSKSNDKERFEKLYSFLNEHYQGNELQINKYFQDENLIFIPGISSQYISSGKAIWRDVSEIFGDYRSYLENYYPKLKDFFVQKIEIPEKPTARNYADILVEIAKKDSIEKTDEDKILKIYSELNKFLKTENPKYSSITLENWWKEFVAQNVFWTNKLNFWRNNNVYVNDDKELYELFKDKSEVAFLKIPQDENTTFTPFLRKAGIRYLSKEVKSEIDHSIDFAEAEKLTKQVNELVIYIVRYLYQKRNEIYETAKQDGRLLQLINLTCYGVEELNVKYTLQTESAYGDNVLFLDGNRLYLKIDDNFDSSDNLKDFDRISIELAKIFGYPEGLSDFIETLFSKSSNEKREKSLITKKIGNLPKDEFEWFTKNAAQTINVGTTSSNSDEIEVSDEENQDKNLISENDSANVHTASEFSHQNVSNSENVKPSETNRSVTKSVDNTISTSVESSNQSKQNQAASDKSENNTKTDWSSEVDPWQVEVGISDLALAEIKATNFTIEKSSRTEDQDSNNSDEKESLHQENLSPQAKREIGKTGEIHALKALQNKFLNKYENSELLETEDGFDIVVNSQIKVEINWLNKHTDCGVGRDIEYIENSEKYFVEVKATKTNSKEIFQISRAEWELSKKELENFSIFRVYNAGTNQAECKEIRNPYKKWLEERLSVQNITVRI